MKVYYDLCYYIDDVQHFKTYVDYKIAEKDMNYYATCKNVQYVILTKRIDKKIIILKEVMINNYEKEDEEKESEKQKPLDNIYVYQIKLANEEYEKFLLNYGFVDIEFGKFYNDIVVDPDKTKEEVLQDGYINLGYLRDCDIDYDYYAYKLDDEHKLLTLLVEQF